MALLRDSPTDLVALAGAAAEYRGIPEPSFVEKDYWAMELLRSVMKPLVIPPLDGKERSARALFKGGTSLSKAFGIIDRFSEDIDILVEHEGLGSAARDSQVLRPICERARVDLGLTDDQAELREHTTGTSRNVHYRYPQRIPSAVISPFVRLEMGIRGGTMPGVVTRPVLSYIAEFVTNAEVDAEFDDLTPIDADLIAPVRTLTEKLALLHGAATLAVDGENRPLGDAGRHFGDIARLLGNAEVQAALATSEGSIAVLASDVDGWSEKAGWRFTPRPEEGYASSVAFDPASEVTQISRASYADAMGLMWGNVPSFDECLAIVEANAHLL